MTDHELLELAAKAAFVWSFVGQFLLIGYLVKKGTTTGKEFLKALTLFTGPLGILLYVSLWLTVYMPVQIVRTITRAAKVIKALPEINTLKAHNLEE